MSNQNAPYGFRYVGLIDGSAPNFGIRTVQLSPTNNHSIYGGDVAAAISAGYYDVATEVGGGAAIGGVFLPDFIWQSKSNQTTMRSRAWLGNSADIVAGGTLTAKVVVHPHALFQVRSNGSTGAAVSQANIGDNINFAVGAGPGNNLISTFSADQSDEGAGASLPFRIYGLVQAPVTDPTALYNEIFVVFNNLKLP